jgi:hypothetical protein
MKRSLIIGKIKELKQELIRLKSLSKDLTIVVRMLREAVQIRARTERCIQQTLQMTSSSSDPSTAQMLCNEEYVQGISKSDSTIGSSTDIMETPVHHYITLKPILLTISSDEVDECSDHKGLNHTQSTASTALSLTKHVDELREDISIIAAHSHSDASLLDATVTSRMGLPTETDLSEPHKKPVRIDLAGIQSQTQSENHLHHHHHAHHVYKVTQEGRRVGSSLEQQKDTFSISAGEDSNWPDRNSSRETLDQLFSAPTGLLNDKIAPTVMVSPEGPVLIPARRDSNKSKVISTLDQVNLPPSRLINTFGQSPRNNNADVEGSEKLSIPAVCQVAPIMTSTTNTSLPLTLKDSIPHGADIKAATAVTPWRETNAVKRTIMDKLQQAPAANSAKIPNLSTFYRRQPKDKEMPQSPSDIVDGFTVHQTHESSGSANTFPTPKESASTGPPTMRSDALNTTVNADIVLGGSRVEGEIGKNSSRPQIQQQQQQSQHLWI